MAAKLVVWVLRDVEKIAWRLRWSVGVGGSGRACGIFSECGSGEQQKSEKARGWRDGAWQLTPRRGCDADELADGLVFDPLAIGKQYAWNVKSIRICG
jgi:hypothetical protein